MSADALFKAIKNEDKEKVRECIQTKSILADKQKVRDVAYPSDIANDGYKFLGAYIGAITPLQYAMFTQQDAVAADIIECSFAEHLNVTFGGGNTTLHLAALLGSADLIQKLLSGGADPSIKNKKGFLPVDVADDAEIRNLFVQK